MRRFQPAPRLVLSAAQRRQLERAAHNPLVMICASRRSWLSIEVLARRGLVVVADSGGVRRFGLSKRGLEVADRVVREDAAARKLSAESNCERNELER